MAGRRGRGSQSEQSLLKKLNEMLPSQAKVYYIMWKYAPNLLQQKIDSFDALTETYKVFTKGMDEAHCERWLVEESVQAAVKYLLKRVHGQKLIELYEIYFENAKKDVNSFKAFVDFSEKFFEQDGESEVLSILKNVDIPGE